MCTRLHSPSPPLPFITPLPPRACLAEVALAAWLRQQAADGWALVGLEQTAASVPLQRFVFPRRTVLLLGREREGIPAPLLPLLHHAVEIPQRGVVRWVGGWVDGSARALLCQLSAAPTDRRLPTHTHTLYTAPDARGGRRSLNVHVAGAIAMFEYTRQQLLAPAADAPAAAAASDAALPAPPQPG